MVAQAGMLIALGGTLLAGVTMLVGLTPGLAVLAVVWTIGLLLVWVDSKVYTVVGQDDREPYLTRLVLGRLRFHIFWRGDVDPDPHDHPWGFWTFPFVPYLEEVVMGPEDAARWQDLLGVADGLFRFQNYVASWRWHYRPATYLHRVLGAAEETTSDDSPVRTYRLTGRPILTIVWTERPQRDWGFLKIQGAQTCWVGWREYIWGGGKHAPCEPDKE